MKHSPSKQFSLHKLPLMHLNHSLPHQNASSLPCTSSGCISSQHFLILSDKGQIPDKFQGLLVSQHWNSSYLGQSGTPQ